MSRLHSLLVIDDDSAVTASISKVLSDFYQVYTAQTAAGAIALLKNHTMDMVLLDLQLGHENSLPLISEWIIQFPQTEIIVLSGQREVKVAIDCMRKGATDYLTKPVTPEELLSVVNKTLEKRAIKKSVQELGPLIRTQLNSMIGKSPQWCDVVLQGQKLKNKTQLNILILGESGTGKEVFSQFLHDQEEDSKRPYVTVNMPAIPSNLLESELFGVEKGAFTDAKTSRPGKFELAQRGDIFLDEIGDLPLELQSKLLRVLQEKQCQRLGSQKYHSLVFRAISATNQNLTKKIQDGLFREDLFYRLSDLVITLPPLRERLEDIPILVEHFLRKYSASNGHQYHLSNKAMEQLMSYTWPGNIRQLESTIKRAVALTEGALIDSVVLMDWSSLSGPSAQPSLGYQDQIQQFEQEIFKKALTRHQGKAPLAMKELGLSRATFYRKLQELGLSRL